MICKIVLCIYACKKVGKKFSRFARFLSFLQNCPPHLSDKIAATVHDPSLRLSICPSVRSFVCLSLSVKTSGCLFLSLTRSHSRVHLDWHSTCQLDSQTNCTHTGTKTVYAYMYVCVHILRQCMYT